MKAFSIRFLLVTLCLLSLAFAGSAVANAAANKLSVPQGIHYELVNQDSLILNITSTDSNLIYPDHTEHFYLVTLTNNLPTAINLNKVFMNSSTVTSATSKTKGDPTDTTQFYTATKTGKVNKQKIGATDISSNEISYAPTTGLILASGQTVSYVYSFNTTNGQTGQYNISFSDGIHQIRADPNITACGSLVSANGIYNITSNFGATQSDCLQVNAANITIDGQGSTIGVGGFIQIVSCDAGSINTLKNLTFDGGSYFIIKNCGAGGETYDNLTVQNQIQNSGTSLTSSLFQNPPVNTRITNIIYKNNLMNRFNGDRYYMGLWSGDAQLFNSGGSIINDTIINVTFSDNTLNSGVGGGAAFINLFNTAEGSPTTMIIANNTFQNIQFVNNAITTGSSDNFAIGLVGVGTSFPGTSILSVTNNTVFNVSGTGNSIPINGNNPTTLSFFSVTNNNGNIANLTFSNNNITTNLSGGETVYYSGTNTNVSNLNLSLSYSFSSNSTFLINTTTIPSLIVYNIPTAPSSFANYTSLNSFLNYSAGGIPFENFSFYYTIPSQSENNISMFNLTLGSFVKINNTGSADLTQHLYNWNSSAIGLRGMVGLYVPMFIPGVQLIAPANGSVFTVTNPLTNTTPITLDWISSGANLSYFSNVTINGVANATNIVSTSGAHTTLALNFAVGTYLWNVSSYNGSSTNTSSNFTFTVNPFVMTLTTPITPGQNFSVGDVNLLYTVISNRFTTCNTSLDSILINSSNFSSPGTNSKTLTTTPAVGGHTWGVFCYDPGNLSFNATINSTFLVSLLNFTNQIPLLNTSDPVIGPQRIFYDINNNINVLYFTQPIGGANQTLWVQTIVNNVLNHTSSLTMNQTKDFVLLIREPSSTGLLLYDVDGVDKYFVNITFSGLAVSNLTTNLNVTSNSFYDAFTYAYTKQFNPISYSSSSYYLYLLPTVNDTLLIRQNISSTTLTSLTLPAHPNNQTAQSISHTSDLSTWYYAIGGNCTATTANLSIYKYDGSSQTFIATPDSTCYPAANISAARSFFQYDNFATYFMSANLNQSVIYRIEDGANITLPYAIPSPSSFVFIDNQTFIFFSNESNTNFAYSCYFGNNTPFCNRFNSVAYGAPITYNQGPMTSSTTIGTASASLQGQLFNNNNQVFLKYNQIIYDVKFVCYDEVLEYRKAFNVSIYSDTASVVLNSSVWGYAIPSSILGSGRLRAYSSCTNGTTRLYIIGLTNNFQTDFYSLNTPQGQFYTFNVKDSFGNPIPGAIVTAYRFSNVKQAQVVVEQGITDITGTTTLFLQPQNPYRMTVTANNYAPLSFDLVPSTLNPINIIMSSNSTGIVNGNNQLLDGITISLTPSNLQLPNASTNITFTVIAARANLGSFSMIIYRLSNNGSKELVYSNEQTNSPSGGSIFYTASPHEQGRLQVSLSLRVSGAPFIPFPPFNFSSNISLINYVPVTYMGGGAEQEVIVAGQYLDQFLHPANGLPQQIAPWFFYLLIVISAMLVGGFIARYTYEGAGAAAAIILIGGTVVLGLTQPIFTIGAGSSAIEVVAWHLTTLTIIMVGSVTYLMNQKV